MIIQSKLGAGSNGANRLAKLIQVEKFCMKTHEFSETFQLKIFKRKTFQVTSFQQRFPTLLRHENISTGFPDQNTNVRVNSNIE